MNLTLLKEEDYNFLGKLKKELLKKITSRRIKFLFSVRAHQTREHRAQRTGGGVPVLSQENLCQLWFLPQ
jgi:hypothetical protein